MCGKELAANAASKQKQKVTLRSGTSQDHRVHIYTEHKGRNEMMATAESAAHLIMLHITLIWLVSQSAYGADKSFSENPILSQWLMFALILI